LKNDQSGKQLNGIVLIDRRGLIGEKDFDVLSRHEKYGQLLKERNEDFRLVVLSRGNSNSKVIYENENILIWNYFGNRFRFLPLVRLWRDKGIKPTLLIAGEPTYNFYSAVFLQLVHAVAFKRGIPIQLQIHFDPNQFRNSSRILNRVYYLVTLVSISLSSSVRVVNQLQLISIPRFLLKRKKIAIAAIPISLETSAQFHNYPTNRPKTIGILGRLHSERGLQNFSSVLSSIPDTALDSVIVAGDGPLRDQFLNDLQRILGESKVVYLGHLDQSGKENFWGKVGVLLSLPEFESYGLSMLEALMHGIPVIASKTIGSQDLSLKAPVGWFHIIELPVSSETFENLLENAYKIETDRTFYSSSLEFQEMQSESLIQSWIGTSKIS
jgi:glycosyltransferase involved in cell wall biosynthesis